MAAVVLCAVCRTPYDSAPEFCDQCLADPFVAAVERPDPAPVAPQPAAASGVTEVAEQAPGCGLCGLPPAPGDTHCQGCGTSLAPTDVPVDLLLGGVTVTTLAPGTDRTLGRGTGDPGIDAAFESYPGVSRRHARLVHTGSHVELTDLGSTNGTYADGERLTSTRRWPPDRRVEVSLGESAALVLEPRGRR